MSREVSHGGALAGRRRTRSLNGRVIQLSALALSFVAISVLVVTSYAPAFVAQNNNVDQPGQRRLRGAHRHRRRHGHVQNVTGLMPLVNQ